MPGSPQKQITRTESREPVSDSSDSEVEGLLERDFDGVNALESMLLSELCGGEGFIATLENIKYHDKDTRKFCHILPGIRAAA